MSKAEAILVVEDEPVLRFLIVEELEDAGYEVFEADDASHAIAILEAQADIRLVLTDIDLFTAAEGLELAKLVRDRWPPIRIILTSGNWSFAEAKSLLPSGLSQNLMLPECFSKVLGPV